MFCPNCGFENSDSANFCQACGRALTTQTIAAASPPAAQAVYAGFWMRFVAHMIDKMVLTIPGLFIAAWAIIYALSMASVFEDIEDIEDLAQLAPFFTMIALIALVSFCMDWLYRALMESSSWQATLGKRALGIKVTDLNGNRISFLRASGRHFGKILSGLLFSIGFIMAGFTAKKQALHDMIAGTLVVRSY